MTEKTIQIQSITGLHARPAAVFVKLAAKFESDIVLVKDGIAVNGKSILGVMSLAAEKGSRITIRAEGADELEALARLAALLERTHDEKTTE